MIRHDIMLGYIPLTDAVLPIIAHEMGFAAEEGVHLTLVRETSWSTIRDKIAMGIYPVAHMLSPLAIALSAGVGPVSCPVIAPILLGTNGNTVAARPALADSLADAGARFGDALATGRAIAQLAMRKPLRVGVPFPHSMHRELMRLLIERSGGAPDDIEFLIAPPRILPEVMAAGEVDLFVVGEPWGSAAVDQAAGEILLPGCRIWSAAPEKVLAIDAGWAKDNMLAMHALIRAVYRASLWLEQDGNTATAAEILSLPNYLDTSALLIERALSGRIVPRHGKVAVPEADILRLSRPEGLYPWQSAAAFIASRAAPFWGINPIKAQAAALETFRPDIMHDALAPLDVALPTAFGRIEGRTEEGAKVPGTRGAVWAGRSGFFDRSEFAIS